MGKFNRSNFMSAFSTKGLHSGFVDECPETKNQGLHVHKEELEVRSPWDYIQNRMHVSPSNIRANVDFSVHPIQPMSSSPGGILNPSKYYQQLLARTTQHQIPKSYSFPEGI